MINPQHIAMAYLQNDLGYSKVWTDDDCIQLGTEYITYLDIDYGEFDIYVPQNTAYTPLFF